MGGDTHLRKGVVVVGALIAALALVVPAVTAHPAPRAHAAAAAISQAATESSKVTLGDTSVDAPALWTSDASAPNLGLASVLAWTGTNANHSLNVMQSSDGVNYGGKVTFSESSATRPAVAAVGPQATIVLAWTGLDANHSLNLLCQGPACGTSWTGYRKITFGDSSFTSPALAQSGNRFYLVWAGNDANHSVNVWPFTLSTSGSGFAMGTKTVLRQFSSLTTPNLAANPSNQLLLSWDSTSPQYQVDIATSNGGNGWSGATALGETSGVGPSGSVAVDGMPPYWLAWTGTDQIHSLNVRFTSDASQWPSANKATLSDTAFGGPGLGYIGNIGQMLLAWTGTDAVHHLNVATLNSNTTPTLDQRIDTYLNGLSTAQLIGQTIMISVCTSSYAADSTNLNQALQQWDVGSAIIYTSCGDGTVPSTAAGLQQLDQALQSNANHSGTLLIGIDEEGGTVDRLAPYYGSTPSAWSLGQSGNPQNAYNQATTDAGRMRALGLNADFAPVVDVYQSQFSGIGSSRTFGSTPGAVATYAGAFLDGLQQHSVAGSLKHWPGLGASTGNPDVTLPTINQTQGQMQAIDFPPYSTLLYQNPGMVMVTTVLAPAYDANAPADLSPALVNGVLRGQIGYQGVVVTDALGGKGLSQYMQQQGYTGPTAIGEAGVRAFLAGDDILLCPLTQNDLQAVVNSMTQALNTGRITTSELRTAVHRIIRLKVELGVITV
jgi:beta-N-acetylhexosaminidase